MAEVQNGGGEEKKSVVITAFKPQLVVPAPKATDAVQFYKSAFGAEEVSRVLNPKRKAEQEQPLVLAADLKLGDSVFSVSDLSDDASQAKIDGSGITFSVVTDDIEGAISKAVTAGAVAEGEVTEDEVVGRVGKVKDPYGYIWVISTPAVAAAKTAEEEAAPRMLV